jgi:hypothetical protein
MVMAVKNTSFVQAVTLLKTCKQTLSHNKKQDPKTNRSAHYLPPNTPKLHRSDCKPVAIENILSGIIRSEQPHLTESGKTDSSPQSTTLSDRIAKLQQDVYYEKYKTFRVKAFQFLNHVDELKTLMVERFEIVKTEA